MRLTDTSRNAMTTGEQYQPNQPIGTYLFSGGIGLLIGYFYAWTMTQSVAFSAVGLVVAIILAYAVRYARDAHATDVISSSELMRAHRKDEAEHLKLMLRASHEQNERFEFTSEAFDTDARRLLMDLIAQSRGKNKKKQVTATELLHTLLRNIK